jgi:hypothetical protein
MFSRPINKPLNYPVVFYAVKNTIKKPVAPEPEKDISVLSAQPSTEKYLGILTSREKKKYKFFQKNVK